MLWIFLAVFFCFHSCLAAVDGVKTIEVPVCEDGTNYTLPHFYYCDRYFSCINGFVHEGQCEDGFSYEYNLGCIYTHFVNCSKRPYHQPAVVNGPCLHLNGLFPDEEHNCQHFYECSHGEANLRVCQNGLVFDKKAKTCRQPSEDEIVQCFEPKQELVPPETGEVTPEEVEQAISSEQEIFEINGVKYKCPKEDLYPFGDHSRHPFPGSCRFYVLCWRSGKTTVNGCPEGTGFNPASFTCEKLVDVTQCS